MDAATSNVPFLALVVRHRANSRTRAREQREPTLRESCASSVNRHIRGCFPCGAGAVASSPTPAPTPRRCPCCDAPQTGRQEWGALVSEVKPLNALLATGVAVRRRQ